MIDEGRRFYQIQRRWVLGVALVLAANVVLRLGVVMPFRASVRALDASLVTGREELGEAFEEMDRSLRQAKLLEMAEASVHGIYRNELRVRRDRVAEVRKEITAVAKKHNLDLTSIEYSFGKLGASRKARRSAEVERFVIELPLKGSYEKLKQFVDDLETSSQLLFVDSVTLTDSTEKGGELNLQIIVSTYFWNPQQRGDEAESDA